MCSSRGLVRRLSFGNLQFPLFNWHFPLVAVLLSAGGLFAAPESADKAAKDEPESELQE
jgi:hypothetical protein